MSEYDIPNSEPEEELIKRFYHLARNIVYNRVRNVDLYSTEALTQDIVARLHNRYSNGYFIDNPDVSKGLERWFCVSAVRLVNNHYRDNRGPYEADLDRLSEKLPDGSPSLEEQQITREENETLRLEINNLTPGQQKALNLYLKGLGGPEIAEQLGITEGMVKSRLFRAREKLSKNLNREGY